MDTGERGPMFLPELFRRNRTLIEFMGGHRISFIAMCLIHVRPFVLLFLYFVGLSMCSLGTLDQSTSEFGKITGLRVDRVEEGKLNADHNRPRLP